MIDLERIQIGDEVIVRLPTGQKILGQVEGDEDAKFVKNPEGDHIYFALRENHEWVGYECIVIGHVPSMFGGDW